MTKAWRETVVIPTYEPGKPEKNPVFLEKRVYQGSSGVVYPYPVIESIADEKTDKAYHAVFLENEYLKVMILPELGGRVQMAYDKLRGRHFIYYNQVVKPALVGLAGPWISGGIEFNWPQHHRPSTFLPVDSDIEEHADGSVTVWVNELERMTHQKGMAGFTLRPGCAYLEITGVVYNRTPMPQTFLWWANPAVAVNDHYQSVFPPDIHAVFDHGKRAVSSFPIATGTYYKMDYSAGVDISNYKNIRVPTSYMAVNSRFDFEGGYENDAQAGMLHVANHHVSPGKKQWTWGNGDFGRAWDRNLTDEDGPYIELMAGVYTENQPDFSWLQPYEEKRFTQYFMPYRELGIVKNATKDLLLNIEPEAEGVRLRIFATSAQDVCVTLHTDEGRELLREDVRISPEALLDRKVNTDGIPFDDLTLAVSRGNKTLITWHAEPDEVKPLPDPATAALLPQDIKTTEQLFLTGLHLEQYRHATYNPVDYYEEALRRDPIDVRNNNALGLWLIRHGRFDKAEPYLRTAVRTLQQRNPNPYDGEPIYNLGLCLKLQGRTAEAYDCFYKSTWNAAWQDAGYLACAQLSAKDGRWADALDEVDRSLIRNWHNHKARALKAAILRKLGRKDEAWRLTEESLAIDRFNYGCLFERLLLRPEEPQNKDTLIALLRDEPNNYDETALDYCASGLYDEANQLWKMAVQRQAVSQMAPYYLAWSLEQQAISSGKPVQSPTTHADLLSDIRNSPSAGRDVFFPNRLEAILALQAAMARQPDDAHAAYLLGNIYYDKRQHELAVECWEQSVSKDPTFPTAWRNLALAYFNKQGDATRALDCMERAFSLDTSDARLLMEFDQLRKRLGHAHDARLATLLQFPNQVASRDDLTLEVATLLNLTGLFDEAMQLIDARQFHPWEGGEGKVPAQYQYARTELAKRHLAEGRPQAAIPLLEQCLVYPPHLGEGKLYGAQDNDFHYLLGVAYNMLGRPDKAAEHWTQGTIGPTEPAAALYYNDAKPDKIFYAGLCYRRLGQEDKARGLMHRLVDYGEKHLFDQVRMDYFAVSLPDLLVWDDDLTKRNEVHCRLLMTLGSWGLGQKDRALRLLTDLEKTEINHQVVKQLRSLINYGLWKQDRRQGLSMHPYTPHFPANTAGKSAAYTWEVSSLHLATRVFKPKNMGVRAQEHGCSEQNT